ncbi:Phosphopantetheine adenylyltransferase [Methyloligella halotolerans]|uniref:Phosphopantetheine adenylyltransferase n=1 Tax=Methyloligella halotolerans TaxID=1177755 RepID=A0A1E2S2R4_9HYPH|nr:pantetheine-phosphate adenylyltransferase [Methyloligella halotolerans]ODA68702.1 Phosphopantetheine adenylyltransferase [Methyloligella halotolerans]
MRTALYPGSFDPITFGHVDIVRRAARLVDRLVIAIGIHHQKNPMFSPGERIDLAKQSLHTVARDTGLDVKIATFEGLVVDAAKIEGASIIIRGLRDAADFDYEMQMAGMNAALSPHLETMFLASSPGTRHITATLVRQIAEMGGDVTPFVPACVADAFKRKLSK